MKGRGKDVFKKHRWMFRLLGVDINDSLSGFWKRLSGLHSISVLVFLAYHAVFFLLGVLWRRQDYPLIPTLIMSCGVVTGISTFFKYIMLRRRTFQIRHLITELDGFEADTAVGKYTRWLINLFEGMGLFFTSSSVVKNLIEHPDLEVPFPVWEPYEVNSSVYTRLLHFFCFYYAIALAWLCMVSVDTVNLHLANQLCYRFQILESTLSLVGVTEASEKQEQLIKKKVLPMQKYDDEEIVKKCIDEHVLLLRSTDVLAQILNETFIYQSSNSMSVLLVCLYIFANSEDWVRDTLAFSGALVVVFIQVLTSCWAGELIKSRCEMIHFAAYNNGWPASRHAVKSSLLVVATFTARPVDLKGAYVFKLSLQTYETFIRQAFSFFTVMYQFLN